jgi:hypothetical protein
VIDHYARQGLITVVEGHRPPDVVSSAIEAVVARTRRGV